MLIIDLFFVAVHGKFFLLNLFSQKNKIELTSTTFKQRIFSHDLFYGIFHRYFHMIIFMDLLNGKIQI